MTTSAHSSSDAAFELGDRFPISPAQAAPNRAITRAATFSVLLHVALLTTFGVTTLRPANHGTVPELRVHLEEEDGPSKNHDNAPVIAPLAVPLPVSTEVLAAAIPDPHAETLTPPPEPSASTPPPGDSDTATDTTFANDFSRSDSPSVDASAVLASTGESDRQAPMHMDDPAAEMQDVAIPTSQQAVLTRQILQIAQGMRDSDPAQAHLSWEHEGRQYTAVLTRRPAANSNDVERVAVEISTELDGKQRQTQMQVKRLAFSHFTQFVDRWDPDVQLHDDEIAGRFHSNSEISVGYDRLVTPKFLGRVTTAASSFAIGNSRGHKRGDEIFRAGFETRAQRIALPEQNAPLAKVAGNSEGNGAGYGEGVKVAAIDSAQVRTFTRDTRISFHADGSYGWKTVGSNAPEQREAITTTPAYFVGARNTSLFVRGTVAGTVLVYSPDRIVIEGDLVYAHDPRLEREAHDFLGLVSDKFVDVARPSVTGPGDLTIHAAIYAKRRFYIAEQDFSSPGTMFIYGSLSAGSITASEPRYAMKVVFDRRFEQYRPPGFPMTDRYEIESWDETWKATAEVAQPSLDR